MICQIEPALDSSFINWEYVTFEVQLRAHAEEVDSPSPPFHYSSLTHFGVRRQVKFNRGITL